MIKEFKEEYRWLSNFYLVDIRFQGKRFASVEYAYQSAKSDDKEWKKLCMEGKLKQSKIKRQSRNIERVANWDSIKIDVMRTCLEAKFTQEPLRTLLLETGDQSLQEGNNWGDVFWGVDLETGEGENQLGKLLMEIRAKLKDSKG